ncbi:NACHT domain-containing protein [Actinoplanes sp. NPDC051470]|uniref:NACHT domain-containing protein n=1 Tax=Actinoplanes sp. NPDC051470 TaxID=3157224 RepID=UPI00343107E9
MTSAPVSNVPLTAVPEVLCGFLRAQRVGVVGPIPVDDVTSLVTTDDDYALLNTYVLYEPDGPVGDVTPDRAALLRADLDPSRTEMVVPDRLAPAVPRLNRAVQGLVRRVVALSELLDGFLRPTAVCDDLTTGGSRTDLLKDDDFIRQHASLDRKRVDAIDHLFNGWAKGNTPRLCIVLAPAGHGKSKVTHVLAKKIAAAYQQADEANRMPVPILIPFGQYRRSTSFAGLILEALDRFGNNRLTIDAFQYLVSLRRVLFILDGYDEMVEANPENAQENITAFVQGAGPESRILLTSRSTFYRTNSDVVGQVGDPLLDETDVQVIDLLPFDRVQAKEYLRKRIGEGPDRSNVLTRAQTILDNDRNLEVLGSPIFLAEFVNMVANEKWSIPDIQRRGSLQFLVERTFQRERERQFHEYTDGQQRRFLEGIAFDLLTSGSTGYLREDIELFVAEAVDDELALTNWEALAGHHFLLPDDRGGTTLISIRHQVWRDYFQGSALAVRVNERNETAWDAITNRDLPEGVLRSAAGLIDEEIRIWLLVEATESGDKLVRNLLRMWLLRREPDSGQVAPVPDDLRGLLAGRDLSGLAFTGVSFAGTDLSESNLTGCYLKDCDLTGARFAGAVLDRTTLQDCVVPPGIADAAVASVIIDESQFFGPQLRDRFPPEVTRAASDHATDFTGWVRDVVKARLGKFVKSRMGENNVAVDEAISWTAFMGGTDPQHKDFVVRRLYRALRAEGLVYEGKMNRSGRPTVCLTMDPDARADVVTFVRTDVAGPAVHAVIDRLVGNR